MSKTITINVADLEELLKDAERAADWSAKVAEFHTDKRRSEYNPANCAKWYSESARIRVKQMLNQSREVAA